MQNEINAILSGLPVKHVRQVGPLWDISLGCISGARADGVNLAHDLKAQYEYRKAREAREQVSPPIVERVQDAAIPAQPDPRDAKIAELEALLAKAAQPKPEPVRPEGAFDASLLTDLIRENEPHAEAQRRWLSDFTQLTNRLVDFRLPALNDTERAYQKRLQMALYSSRQGAIETL